LSVAGESNEHEELLSSLPPKARVTGKRCN